jgi:hypothetical protein
MMAGVAPETAHAEAEAHPSALTVSEHEDVQAQERQETQP